VVTGASSGIGEATAKHLDALGFTDAMLADKAFEALIARTLKS